MLAKLEGGPFEKIKGLIEKAIEAGRHFQSPQTGYIHFFPHQKQGDPYHAIPLYENFLFALALLRSKMHENINEAKVVVTNLLHFQHPKGNFPVYLHEYPACRDSLGGIDILAPLYWTIKHFGHVLGGDLRAKLDDSIQRLIQYGLTQHQEYPMPYSMAARFAAGLVAVGRLQKNEEWVAGGNLMLGQLAEEREAWCSTEYLSDLLIALQMADINFFAEERWQPLKDYIVNTWNQDVCAFVGPGVRELQLKQEPKPNLYDLFMGTFFGTFAHRCEALDIYHLQAALIQPIDPVQLKPADSTEGTYKGQKWVSFSSMALLEKRVSQVSLENTYSPLKIVWGDSKFAHTFVCQGCKCSTIEYQVKENGCELFLDLDREIDLQDKEKQREINFYFDFHPDYEIHVDGFTATTFEFGQAVTLELGDHKISLNFEVVDGSGQFLGHISHGNRPSQALHNGDLRFEAYDWNLFVRTIRRDPRVRIKVAVWVTTR